MCSIPTLVPHPEGQTHNLDLQCLDGVTWRRCAQGEVCSGFQVAGLGTTREVELPLSNYKSTIFYYVQRLLQLSCSGAVKTDKLRRIWEPTYT